MENYSLQPDEVVLYKNNCRITSNGVSQGINCELILSNQNIVIVWLSDCSAKVEVFPVEEIKIYKDVPQLKQKDCQVEMYFTSGERTVDLQSKSEVRKFIGKALELVTGKNMAKRVSEKVKGAIGLVDETIGINSVETIISVAENGLVGVAFGGMGKKAIGKSGGTGLLANALNGTKKLFSKESSKPKEDANNIIDNQINKLKKLKELYDAGIITQDEFEAQKKQVFDL